MNQIHDEELVLLGATHMLSVLLDKIDMNLYDKQTIRLLGMTILGQPELLMPEFLKNKYQSKDKP
jgi:hypothetical protein